MEFCTNCGTENTNNDKFCGKCGKGFGADIEKNHCNKCGFILNGTDKYCNKCGQSIHKIYAEESIQRVPVLPQDIRNNIIKYKKRHNKVTCYECGYVGPMGIIKEHVPWYVSWWIIIPFTLGGIILGLLLVFLRHFEITYEVDCPNCDKLVLC
jgi:hypothetical protein